MRFLSFLCVMLAGLPALTSSGAERQHVKASFLAEVKSAKPGASFDVGVLLRIDPQWHIYWENPGESGSPTRVVIGAPVGVIVDAARYPLPESFTQPGDIKGFGYEDEVMLVARVTVPKDWPKGKTLELRADASWLNCKDVCLPGKAKLELSVPVGDAHEGDNTDVFTKWKERLPSPPDAAPFKLEGIASELKLSWSEEVKDVEVLPIPPDGVEVPTITVDQAGKITHIKPVLRRLGGEKKPDAALGLLVTYHDAGGQRRGVRLSIPLKKAGD